MFRGPALDFTGDPNTLSIPLTGTPLMRAVESGSVGIVKLLLERGAKINLRTKTEKTALDIAYEWGSTEVKPNLVKTGFTAENITYTKNYYINKNLIIN